MHFLNNGYIGNCKRVKQAADICPYRTDSSYLKPRCWSAPVTVVIGQHGVVCSERFRQIKWSIPPKIGSTILAEVNYDVNVSLEHLARPTEFINQGKPASKWIKAMWTYFPFHLNRERTQDPASQWYVQLDLYLPGEQHFLTFYTKNECPIIEWTGPRIEPSRPCGRECCLKWMYMRYTKSYIHWAALIQWRHVCELRHQLCDGLK